jgi:hypothetical protein
VYFVDGNILRINGLLKKVIFSRLLKEGPACAEAPAGGLMQVELCEIPFNRGPPKSLVGNAYMLSQPLYAATTCPVRWNSDRSSSRLRTDVFTDLSPEYAYLSNRARMREIPRSAGLIVIFQQPVKPFPGP